MGIKGLNPLLGLFLLNIGYFQTSSAVAANECKIEYAYGVGSGPNSVVKVATATLSLDESKSINQANLHYVKNLQNHPAEFVLQGTQPIVLAKNKTAPQRGKFQSGVSLRSIHCRLENKKYNTTQALVAAYTKAGRSATNIIQALNKGFKIKPNEAIRLLKDTRFSPVDIAHGLKAELNINENELLIAFKQENISNVDRVKALNSAYRLSADIVVKMVVQPNRTTVSQLAQWLKLAGYNGVEVVNALTVVEDDAEKIIQAVKVAFNWNASQLIQGFKQARKIMTLQVCQIDGCTQIATYLRDMGYSHNELLLALKYHFNINARAAYSISVNVFGSNSNHALRTLNQLGFSQQQINAVVN